MEIAVLGLGQMGRSLAGRLIDSGHHVRVWNRTPGRADELVAAGAIECPSAPEAAAGAAVVMTSLTNDDAVRSVLAPNGGRLDGVGPDVAVIDCSTVSPDTSRFLATVYPGRFAAAPIMGSPAVLASGQATQAVGGPSDLLDRLEPVWTAVAQRTIRCGDDPGRATMIKLLNNYLLVGGIAMLAEVVTTGQVAGLGDDFLEEVLGSSPLVAPGLQNRLASIVSRENQGWFPIPLGAKDMGLLADVVRAVGLDLPVASAVQGRYRTAIDQGMADEDIAGVVGLYPR